MVPCRYCGLPSLITDQLHIAMPPCSHSLCWLQLLSHLLCVSDMQAIASSGWAQLCSPTFGLLMLSSHCSSSTPDFPGGSYVTAGQRGPVRQGAAVLLVRRPSAPFSHYHLESLYTCLAYCKYDLLGLRECQQGPRCMRREPVSCAGHQPIPTTTHPGHPLQESTALVVDICSRRIGRRNNIMHRSSHQGAMGPHQLQVDAGAHLVACVTTSAQ